MSSPTKRGVTPFRMRGRGVSRIEALSDCVFAFAVTLLVVSLEVPKTFDALAEIMKGFGAFAISFALLFLVWYNQYRFFRRYGLQDIITIVLNAVLLFVVLFYVYPLKFLFTMLVDRITGGHGEVRLPSGHVAAMLEGDQKATLMLIFGAGYFAVFLVFALLYWHAHRKRDVLELNRFELFDTRNSIQESLLHCAIALLSISLIWIGGPQFAGLAGITYMLTGIAMGVNGTLMGKRRRQMERDVVEEIAADVAESST